MALMVCGRTAKMIIRKTRMILRTALVTIVMKKTTSSTCFVGRVADWLRRDVVENEGSRDNNDKVRGLYDAVGILKPVNPQIVVHYNKTWNQSKSDRFIQRYGLLKLGYVEKLLNFRIFFTHLYMFSITLICIL